MIKERPILFNSAMVRAILSGQKTMTRRVVKGNLNNVLWSTVKINQCNGWTDDHGSRINCPYGVVGDRLWVKETWRPYSAWMGSSMGCEIEFLAGGLKRFYGIPKFSIQYQEKWRPSIFMPRWASRILLEITDVRVERLQSITEEDAIAEGIEDTVCVSPMGRKFYRGYQKTGPQHLFAISSFTSLWDSLSVKSPETNWDSNPWVWVISFRRIEA